MHTSLLLLDLLSLCDLEHTQKKRWLRYCPDMVPSIDRQKTETFASCLDISCINAADQSKRHDDDSHISFCPHTYVTGTV